MIWMTCGSRNTQFFLKFYTNRRQQNTIWELNDGMGGKNSETMELHKSVEEYFEHFYKAKEDVRFKTQLKYMNYYPQMFWKHDDRLAGGLVTMQEIYKVLKTFLRDKYFGLNSEWLDVDIFIHFKEIVGPYLI